MISQAELMEILHYDPETGVFTWKIALKGRQKEVGTILPSGYRVICINYRRFRASRLAFLYMEGRWPPVYADHINGIRDDDRWCNLRCADCGDNARNSRCVVPNSGHKGIGRCRDGWRVKIRAKGKRYEKDFPLSKLDEAIAYARELRTTLHGEFACHDVK